MITLTNDKMTVKINELGAEIKSIRCNDTEYIWGSLKEVWSDCCPLLFPICGGLKDDKYTFEGKEYILQKHGYGSETMFEVESATTTQAVFFHESNEETKACFPFDYELRVILRGDRLRQYFPDSSMTPREVEDSIYSALEERRQRQERLRKKSELFKDHADR